MSHRIFNFSAGPAALPTEVLEASAKAMLDYQGKGFGIAECSHRGKEFEGVLDEAIARTYALLGLNQSTHDVLFLQGGATALFSIIPLNYFKANADFLSSGEWSKKAVESMKIFGKTNIVASSESTNFDHSPAPSEWDMNPDADYFHVCSNETVHGHRLTTWPKHPNLIVDASSEFMSRPHPVNDCAMVYAGSQKNLGPSGLVLVIVRKDLYPRTNLNIPKIWNLSAYAENKSMINTPPTLSIYILLENLRWLEHKGGLVAMEKINSEKAKLIYDAIDSSGGFYTGTVSKIDQRSHMNVTYRLPSEELTDKFVKEAASNEMVALKGYRTVGGIRASIYNAMPVEGCRALSQFMDDFVKKNG
ncbi:MAG TPA: 3-phosphoserine/phosphohydroxythreonine transaminase [Tepidisphaeraceae bacterium]|nr:3-phosphoserine/phosphohydroxythreonine transaminase [Tepidisphaeraceae bacterium]